MLTLKISSWWWIFSRTRAEIFNLKRFMSLRLSNTLDVILCWSLPYLNGPYYWFGNIYDAYVFAFYVFRIVLQIFVANPHKNKPITDILQKNKDRLIPFLSNFHNDRNGMAHLSCLWQSRCTQLHVYNASAYTCLFHLFRIIPSLRKMMNNSMTKRSSC